MQEQWVNINRNGGSTCSGIYSKAYSFDFNTSELVVFSGKGSEQNCPVWKNLGSRFLEINAPVLYWFKITSNTNGADIVNAIKSFKDSQKNDGSFRYLPALKKHHCESSNTLYVGCCGSTKLVDRMFWHFEYYIVGKTQGLQLCHWSQHLNIGLEINVLQLPVDAKELIYVYEKMIAQELKPIVGKH